MQRQQAMSIRSLLQELTGNLRPAHPLTQNRELDALVAVSSFERADEALLMLTAQEFMAAGRDYEGYLHFRKLARAQPGRAALVSLEGMMQARVAGRVPLLRRIAWVKGAIAKLNSGAANDSMFGRLVRGLVFAELPARFATARQAADDLELCLSRREVFPIDLDRGIYRALGSAYRTLGDPRSDEMSRRAAADRADAGILTNASVDPVAGYRFCEPRLVREAEGVYVAEGFDFSNIVFLVDESGVAAIDAGTTVDSTRAAVAALRRITSAPIRTLILTHPHWDHVGGAAVIHERDTTVIAHADFAEELRRVRAFKQPFHWFFGSGPYSYDIAPDRLISREESLRHGRFEVRLIPAASGESRASLFVHLPQHDLLVVGDVFMPYVGAPFFSEGSAEGYLAAIAAVRRIGAKRLVHGHPPLTRNWTAEAMPGLEQALRATYDHALSAANEARPLPDLLGDNFLPPSLRDTPAAVQPYLVVRDHFIRQVYREHAGRWGAHAEGLNLFTRREWGAVLDSLAGHDVNRLTRLLDELLANGDDAMAYEVAVAVSSRHPNERSLDERRDRAVTRLRERYQSIDPFRSIVYSEEGNRPLSPVELPLRAPPAPPPGVAAG
jgi:glyoxylase-like metal-dependent hydrolase (beta-lactamase superfamily II)